jgi:hypothetical protein
MLARLGRISVKGCQVHVAFSSVSMGHWFLDLLKILKLTAAQIPYLKWPGIHVQPTTHPPVSSNSCLGDS